MDNINYVTRIGGATVTVFVPWDCENHCKFCINKQEYANTEGYSTDAIIRSIKIMSAMTPECDFVFTGGEPLSDLVELQRMLEVIYESGHHKVFINTTLPTGKYSETQLADYLNVNYRTGRITGINVSRHLRKYVEECDDSIFARLKFEPRINCVLYNVNCIDPNIKTKLREFIDRFKNITGYVQFRKDYVVTTTENLYDEDNDELLNLLKDTFEYKGSFGRYRMRVGYEFDYEGYKITYHKTLPYSKIHIDTNTFVLYDIIIKQTGEIRDDWDITLEDDRTRLFKADKLDLTAYKDVVYEEYI